MQKVTPLNIPSLKISVTDTSTGLYALMDTAGTLKSGSNYKYYNDLQINGVIIMPEDGNVRMLSGADPTATAGTLLVSGVTYFIPNCDISDLRLIRVGGTSVLCSIEPIRAEPGESFTATGGGSGGASSANSSGTIAGQNNSFVTFNIKATAGKLFYVNATNTTAFVKYIQFHNTATTPAGGATAKLKFAVPVAGTLVLSAGDIGYNGAYFSTGIAAAVSTDLETYVAATAGDLTLDYEYL